MNNDDLSRAAHHAPHLRQLVVLSVPDGRLLGQWTRGVFDAEGFAARLGTFMRATQVVAKAAGVDRGLRSSWIETEEGAVLLMEVGPDQAAGFVFETDVALGLVRVEAQEVVKTLRKAGSELSVELPTARPEPLPGDNVAPTMLDVRTSSRPSEAENTRPRAVRLLEFLHRYAPDPHVTLLRLSLRTGIALEQLDRPEELDESQVDQLAASVRDIIGQEQLGI